MISICSGSHRPAVAQQPGNSRQKQASWQCVHPGAAALRKGRAGDLEPPAAKEL